MDRKKLLTIVRYINRGGFMNKEKVIRATLLCAILSFSAFSAAPSTPTLLSPVNNQTGLAITPSFSWNTATGASTYEIQVSLNSGFSSTVLDVSGLKSTNYNATQHLNPSTYFWRVRAKDSNGTPGNWSNQWNFTTEMVRQFWSQSIASTGSGTVSQQVKDMFTYYSKLKYNYVLIFLNWAYIMDSLHYNSSTGHWIFNYGKYTDHSSSAVKDFLALKSAVEAAGMHVLPGIGALSHQQPWICGEPDYGWNANNALSEFNTPGDLLTFAHTNGLWPMGSNNTDSCNNALNSVTCANDTNKTASDINVEQLRIIQKNWGTTTLGGLYPQYIHLGHDEIGNTTIDQSKFICLVGADKTKDSVTKHGGGAVGQSWLIAHEIKTRYGEVTANCNSGTKIFLYGDCFVPLGNGQAGGLTGDQNGKGGVLQFLRDTMKLANNCIIEPWNYWDVNGATRYNGSMTFNQNTQVLYMQNFGFGYVLASGEAFNYNAEWCGMQNVHQHLQVAFEQVRASQFYPNNLCGFGIFLYDDWDTGGLNDTLAGYTGPILAYFGWTFGDKSLAVARHQSFSPQVYLNFKPTQSRKNLTWTLGTDYNTPSTDRILPAIIEAAQ